MPTDRIIDAVTAAQDAMLLDIADRLQKQYLKTGEDFVSLARAALEVIDEWHV